MDETSAYLEFLKFCLNEEEPVPACIKDIHWHKLLEFATSQTIPGVYAPTLMMQNGKLAKDDFLGNKPTDDDVMEWYFELYRLRKRNEELYKCADKASEWFLENGFPNCILKGQGNSIMYPDAYQREPGDIDIWLAGGREKILEFTTKYYHQPSTQIHVDFPMFRDVDVEVHFKPSYMLNPFTNKTLIKYFDRIGDSQFNHKVSTPDGKYSFFAPTNEFNVIYQLLHLYRHIAKEGIGLRQVVDYYYLLRKCNADGFSQQAKKEFQATLKELSLTRFARAIMYIMHDVLGIKKECLLIEPDVKEGKFLLNEVLLLGNFGRSEKRLKALENAKGHFKRFIILEKYNFRLLKHYPSEVIWRPYHDLKMSWKDRHQKSE